MQMKTTFKTALYSALVGATALVGVAGTAAAGGFAVREQSTEGQGASFAGIAAGGSDLSSMFFNPATITLFEGMQSEGNASLILPYSKAKNGAGSPGGASSGNIGKIALVPSNYASYQVNDKLFIGFMGNSPFGLVTKGNSTWAGSPHGIESDLFMIQAGPTVGYKINDMISIGAAVRGVYSRVKLTQNAGAGGIAKLKGNDWGVNFSVGVLFSPTESTRIGIGYNSETRLKFTGTQTVSLVPALNARISAKLTTPGTLTVGLRQKISENFTALLGFEWADWSKMKNLTAINRNTGAVESFVDFSWKDSFFYSIGGEYNLSEDTTLRAGFAFEDSPVPDATRSVRIPDANRYWLSVGASHKINEKFRVSVGFTHIIVDDGEVNLGGANPLTATFKQNVNIIAISGTYKM
ncbi:Long-chain fatty acid transport protein [hydrothermal vent metagenome]|uniref:Long-chain fatty acid transport protein n=1 Tax=hydrothermal vent metagenome TaxID=652676 RepID=A0A3B0QYD3_9ZZZZ